LFAYGDSDGIGIESKLQHPLAVVAAREDIYIADSYNHKIKLVQREGKTFKLTTISGTGNPGDATDDAKITQFNEPGGLCISEDEKYLYIADTNNHAIKVLDLKQRTVHKLVLRFPDSVDTNTSQDNAVDSRVLNVSVSAGIEVSIALNVSVDLPEGATLSTEAPNAWTLKAPDKAITAADMKGRLTPLTKVSMIVNLPTVGTVAMAELHATLFVCLTSGVCVMKKVLVKVMFAAGKEETGTTKSVDVVLKPTL
ncbi:unnamed protein product, partial [Meganyctiphanes norvegica]